MSKHLLLTGGAGFIGHHTVEHLLKNTDWKITVMDRLTYAGKLRRLQEMDCWEAEGRRVRFYYHDFRSPDFDLQTIFKDFGSVQYLIHMGAESHVDRSISDPLLFAQSNVIGSVNMMELGLALNVERFIQVSTDEVYGAVDLEGSGHIEGSPHRPSNPYAASKAAAEDFALAFYKSKGLPVIITNTMNNFGERQDVEKFVPKTIRALLLEARVPVHVLTDDKQHIVDISSRCWLHARNHASALLFLLHHGIVGEQYNVAGDWHNVVEMAKQIASILSVKAKLQYVDYHKFRPGHDMHYGLDADKIARLGWRAPVAFDESLERTVRWTVEHKEWIGL